MRDGRARRDVDPAERGARRGGAQPTGPRAVRVTAAGRRIGLVFRSSSGRDAPYRRLAAMIGELVSSDQDVRLVR
ncbi:putative oxyR [Mycobacterium xenopi 3993]|nr:putative oxyR [Mycobacterium xenopi 3993]